MKKTSKKRDPKKAAELLARATNREVERLEKELDKFRRKQGSDKHASLKKRIKTLTKKQNSWHVVDIARKLNCPLLDMEEAIEELRKEGLEVNIHSGWLHRQVLPPTGKGETHFTRLQKGGWLKIGVLGDTQLGNRHQRLDVLNTAYDHYESEDIEVVYHTGNLVDGFLPFINQHELLKEAGTGIESQLAYAHTKYPHKKGIQTYFVTGECHEGWWAKKAGINIGRVMMDRFRPPLWCDQLDENEKQVCPDADLRKGFCPKHGRTDLRYVGHEEFDTRLQVPQLKKGVKGPMMRVMHPGGGTAYALSYKSQKIAESLQGGEKPQIQLIGHYHKFDYNYHREVHNVMTGCLEDQTMFMRKLTIPAHVGYLILHLYIGRDGILERFRVEWIPWYDKKFYQKYETW